MRRRKQLPSPIARQAAFLFNVHQIEKYVLRVQSSNPASKGEISLLKGGHDWQGHRSPKLFLPARAIRRQFAKCPRFPLKIHNCWNLG
jgi:hypothetical protein